MILQSDGKRLLDGSGKIANDGGCCCIEPCEERCPYGGAVNDAACCGVCNYDSMSVTFSGMEVCEGTALSGTYCVPRIHPRAFLLEFSHDGSTYYIRFSGTGFGFGGPCELRAGRESGGDVFENNLVALDDDCAGTLSNLFTSCAAASSVIGKNGIATLEGCC